MPSSFDFSLSRVRVVLPTGRALFHVNDLKIPHGRHLLIQGESGTGKTTFLHLLAGLLTTAEGQVSLGPSILGHLSDDERCALRRREIGVVFQKLNLLEHLTTRENAGLTLPPGTTDDNVLEALRKVRLEERANDRCAKLSTGEQQRVAVARILAQSPQIILADEPTSSLDAKNTAFVMESLKECAKGKTLVVVSHDQRISSYFDETLSFADYSR